MLWEQGQNKDLFNIGTDSSKKKDKGKHFQLYNKFTALEKLMRKVFYEIKNRGFLPLPPLMKPNPKRRESNEYFKYHKSKGHDTVNRWQLKNAVNNALQRAWLKEYIDHDGCKIDDLLIRGRKMMMMMNTKTSPLVMTNVVNIPEE